MLFDWDESKRQANLAKHLVDRTRLRSSMDLSLSKLVVATAKTAC